MHTAHLVEVDYTPIGETGLSGGSPLHQDVAIHRASLLSGELLKRLDPVAYPQLGRSYGGTVDARQFPPTPPELPVASGAVDDTSVTVAPVIVPAWTAEPTRASSKLGLDDGWAVHVGGHGQYQLVIEYLSNGQTLTNFVATTFNAPQTVYNTGLTSVLAGNSNNVLTAAYVIHAGAEAVAANALILVRYQDPTAPPPGPSFNPVPTLDADGYNITSGTAVLTTGTWHLGITYGAGTNFGFSTVNGPSSYDLAGAVGTAGQQQPITDIWISPTSSRADAVAVASNLVRG